MPKNNSHTHSFDFAGLFPALTSISYTLNIFTLIRKKAKYTTVAPHKS